MVIVVWENTFQAKAPVEPKPYSEGLKVAHFSSTDDDDMSCTSENSPRSWDGSLDDMKGRRVYTLVPS